MKNIKYLRVLLVITISLVLMSIGIIKPITAMADDTSSQLTNIPSIEPPTQAQLDSLKAMTLSQLQAQAKPLPASAEKKTPTDSYILKSFGALPQDGNIYYSTESGNGITCYMYYKALYATIDTGSVNYYVYHWEADNGVLTQSKEEIGSIPNPVLEAYLYNEIGGINGITANGQPGQITANGKIYTSTRLLSAVDVANQFVDQGTQLNSVVIATGTTFADSLSGTVLASKLNAPILFVNTGNDAAVYSFVSSNVKTGGTVYILGKEGAVSTDVENKLISSGFTVKRLGGDNRFDTSEQINNALGAVQGTPVVIANAENYPDALSISSVAASKRYPILLTETASLPQQTIDQLNNIKPSQIFVVGGTGVISDDVLNTLKSYCSNVVRLAGTDRYETSIAICKYFNLGQDSVLLATGKDFKDALAGSVLAAKYNTHILLVDSDVTKLKQFLDSSKYKQLIILGNTDAITIDMQAELVKRP